MARKNFLALFSALAVVLFVARAIAGDGVVLGLSPDVDELELYKSTTDENPALVLTAGDMSFPAAILAESKNGMFKIPHDGAEYWVISDDVKSSIERSVDTSCDPKMAGSIVAHGKRGAGEGCQ